MQRPCWPRSAEELIKNSRCATNIWEPRIGFCEPRSKASRNYRRGRSVAWPKCPPAARQGIGRSGGGAKARYHSAQFRKLVARKDAKLALDDFLIGYPRLGSIRTFYRLLTPW